MGKGLRIKTFIIGIVFFICSMTGMLMYASGKAIVIDNVAEDQVTVDSTLNQEAGEAPADTTENLLRFRPGEDNTDYLCIPLEAGIKAENITMENHYMDRQMWIYIKGVSKNYYATEAVFGNISKIEAGSFEVVNGAVLLKFSLSDVYECKSVLEEDHLYLEFTTPKEVYDKIIVLDAGCGGEDIGYHTEDITEKELTLDIVKRVKTLLEKTDIKVYYTRTEDVTVADSNRIELANAVRADLFVSIRLNQSEDAAVYGTETFYNENYFIPGMGSVDLADIVEKNVVTAISGKGNGLFPAGEEDVLLQQAKIPAALIKVGYISNKQEAILLQREDYRDRIAEGIYLAILEAYE